MFVFDTDVISELMRRRSSEALVSRVAATPRHRQFTTSITVGEIVYGAYRNRDQTEILMTRFETMILPNLTVLPFEEGSARVYGRLKAELWRRGDVIGDEDMQIAAIALERDFTVVTANVRHFDLVPGLPVENWFE
jgi:tRNA(fMet)-specific endonuclease VapC